MKHKYILFLFIINWTPSTLCVSKFGGKEPFYYDSSEWPKEETVLIISPKDRITYLKLSAEQDGKKAKGGFIATIIGALAATGRLCQNSGNVDKCTLIAIALTVSGGGYGAWCAWSQYSNNQDAEELKKEHDITVRHHRGDEDYLERSTRETQTDSN